MSESRAKADAKARDDYTCQFCGMDDSAHNEEYGQGLHAHHIVKQNDDGPDTPENLITVCMKCHNTIEQTQARALSVIREGFTHDEDHERVLEQRDALIDRVHLLERAIRTPGFYAQAIGSVSVSGEVVSKMYGDKVLATSNSDKAREAYEDWGSVIRRTAMSASKEDIADAHTDVSSKRLNRIVEQAVTSDLLASLPSKVADEMEGRMR